MTADEIVQEVCENLNLTSDEAKSRVARRLNNRYRRATSSIGMESSRRGTVSTIAVIGNRTLTFTNVEKLITVYRVSGTKNVILTESTPDEMVDELLISDPPSKFAVTRIYPTSVDIKVNATPATAYTLYADAHVTLATLSGSAKPQFPESFHDLLISGVMADEYKKMEKSELAKDCENEYASRLSDLRLWIAKTAWLNKYQGRDAELEWWSIWLPNRVGG